MMNKAILIGRLGQDPETRATQGGQEVCNFSLATSEKWTDKGGDSQEKTEWHKIVTFGKLASVCTKYLKKGKMVCVEGRLQTRKWDDKDGNKRETTEVVALSVIFLGGDREPGDDRRERAAPPPAQQRAQPQQGQFDEPDFSPGSRRPAF